MKAKSCCAVPLRTALPFVVVGLSAVGLMGCPKRDTRSLTPCVVSSFVRQVRVNDIRAIDVLFVVDKSLSMEQEQSALAREIPRMVRILSTGDVNDNGVRDSGDFDPLKDGVQFGVVSTDMGVGRPIDPNAPGDGSYGRCNQLGEDGVLRNTFAPSAGSTEIEAAPGVTRTCDFTASSERFLSLVPSEDANGNLSVDIDDSAVQDTIADISCRALVGTEGCGYEQQLEAGLKAISGNDVRFNNAGAITGGRGDQENAGFVRPDSLLAIIVVTDEDDCSVNPVGVGIESVEGGPLDNSAGRFGLFAKDVDPSALPVTSPPDARFNTEEKLANLRCPDVVVAREDGQQLDMRWQAETMHPAERYVENLIAQRADFPELVVFSVIAGVEPVLIEELDAGQRSYDDILADPSMEERVVVDELGLLVPAPACVEPDPDDPGGDPFASAAPARRLITVARDLDVRGASAVVKSICNSDFRPALSGITDKIVEVLRGSCLTRRLPLESDGTVNCAVLETLPLEGGTTSCEQLADVGRTLFRVDDDGREVCEVQQITVDRSVDPPAVDNGTSGWYYDDFSAEVQEQCPADRQYRAAFTNAFNDTRVQGSTIRFECLNPVSAGIDSDEATIGSPCEPGSSGDAFCAASAEDNLVCDGATRTCRRFCGTESGPSDFLCADLGGNVCDDSVENRSQPVCVNPSCN